MEPNKQYIGKLSKSKYDEYGTSGTIVDNRNEMVGFLEVMSANENDNVYNSNVSIFPNVLRKVGFIDNYSPIDSERQINLHNFLDNKIFIFNVREKILDGTNKMKFSVSIDDVLSIDVDESVIDNYNNYEMIPIIHGKNNKEFDKKLLDGDAFNSNSFDHINMDDNISFVIYHNDDYDLDEDLGYLYSYVDIKNKNLEFPDAILFHVPTEDDPITVRSISGNMNDGIFFNKDKTIAFIPNEFLMERNQNSRYSIDDFSTFEYNLGSDINKAHDKSNNNLNSSNNVDKNNTLIEQFKKVIKTNEYKLAIDDNDLVNIHTSIKSNLLTVLSGMSGTGKSRIISAYADALGINNSEQFKFISVRPFWQDDSDLLGFVDNTTNNYYPGDTGLIEIIQKANMNKDKLYLITLDEMNLARVEHYFSQFLSVLERDEKSRYIKLYNGYLEKRLYNSEKYPSEILIPENVRFVGTMNVDDSTFEFSNKLLDRANIINLKMQKFIDRKSFISNETMVNLINSPSYTVFDSKLYSYRNEFEFSDEYLQMLWDLNVAINNANPNQGVSWRTINSIESFIGNLPSDYLDIPYMFDLQLSSRIFTKLRGTSSMLSSLLSKDENGSLKGDIVKILDDYSDLSDFSISRNNLINKTKELEINGFAR
ncbi:McrB family protein [Lactobacillus sp. Sy-1]|uniref:McrB family protein n=1 Tax=Lactobacillus sp. Sy-1 TaxID=2109645 RepID=UPI001C5BB8CC|nr:hypothetical protein [Lactobacillus sp. Sy-1]MBW1606073.1 hypothetical protein [Lactobacillus sp. Sy-1]